MLLLLHVVGALGEVPSVAPIILKGLQAWGKKDLPTQRTVEEEGGGLQRTL